VEPRRFTTNDAGFVCERCGLEVLPLGTTSRNHCPGCLYSRHVDVNPGDRASKCGGMMRPVGVETDGKRGFVIVHRCERCGEVRRNRSAADAAVQPDDMRLIVELSVTATPLPLAERDWSRDRGRRGGARDKRRT
jgi:hypothetical protein